MSNFSLRRLALVVLALVGFSRAMVNGVEPGKPSVTALETTAFRAMKEPMILGIPDRDREGFITRRGLTIVSDVGINDLRARFVPRQFTNPGVPSISYVCTALVTDREK